MQIAKINVTRIDKAHLFEGKNGKYLDLVFHTNKDGPDQYGNEGFVTQGVSKEARESGVKGAIVGNWKSVGGAKGKPAATSRPAEDEDQTVPF